MKQREEDIENEYRKNKFVINAEKAKKLDLTKFGPLVEEGTRHISYAKALVSQRLRRLLFILEKYIWRYVLKKLSMRVRKWHRHLTRFHGFVFETSHILESCGTLGCFWGVFCCDCRFCPQGDYFPLYVRNAPNQPLTAISGSKTCPESAHICPGTLSESACP